MMPVVAYFALDQSPVGAFDNAAETTAAQLRHV
jgi:hypothetical protein